MYNINQVEKVVKETLLEKRYYHSVCTAKQCKYLAKIYKVDENKAMLVRDGT